MKNYITRSIFSAVSVALLFFLISTVSSYSLTCFPTCSSSDGRFLSVTEGAGFATLTPAVMNIRIIIPAGTQSFQLGVFDGDHLNGANGEFHWDNGNPETPGLYNYTLKIDPDRDNNGPIVFEVQNTELLDNDWVDFDVNNSPLAMDENGDHIYTFTIALINGASSSNQFKIRSTAGIIVIDEIFSFIANVTSGWDIPIVFPNVNFEDGFTLDDRVGTTYDGTFTFFFEIPEEAVELVFWDGDADRGNFDGTGTDTDDPNTPNTIPAFAPPDSDVVAEGLNPPDPPDDSDTILFFRSPAVTYKLIAPDGQEFNNPNPSGNQEWENFVISTLDSDPTRVDHNTSVIPAGIYEIRFEGLDMGNFVSINPLFPLTLRGEVIPDPELPPASVPTISEWGLIALAVVMAIIGIVTVRRRSTNLGN
ncbi:MAG: hypothetical protein DHS20C13_02140 [Thermodesulfobacteriota bacterium]|nr:MAG: hypothetical protein DHS20C13_02140 [Thermodesulfobacteriota bacterium]